MYQSQPSETTPLLSQTTIPRQSRFTLRRARFSDLAGAARACSLAFFDEVLFGRLIHPNRHKYPYDFDKYWYRRFVVDYWDWSHIYLVTTETVTEDAGPCKGKATGRERQKEVITGFAHWSRIAPSSRDNYLAGWGLAWWDPRKFSLCFSCLSPLEFPFLSAFQDRPTRTVLRRCKERRTYGDWRIQCPLLVPLIP